jgi:hypothetical protein
MSAKLTPEICINNASSNSRLTAAGRWATATDTIHRPVSGLFFLSLPTFDEKTTELHLHTEILTETVLHLNLGHFVGLFWFCFCFFFLVLPLWWDNYRTTSEAPSPGFGGWGMKPKIIKTETSVHLNLEGFFCNLIYFLFFYFLFYILFFYIYIYFFFHLLIFYFYSYLYSFFYFQSSLCLSNAFSAYSWLVHCLSLFISLKPFLFVCLFLLDYLFFPFPLTSLLSIPSHPSSLNITSAIITARKYLIAHSTVQVENSRQIQY